MRANHCKPCLTSVPSLSTLNQHYGLIIRVTQVRNIRSASAFFAEEGMLRHLILYDQYYWVAHKVPRQNRTFLLHWLTKRCMQHNWANFSSVGLDVLEMCSSDLSSAIWAQEFCSHLQHKFILQKEPRAADLQASEVCQAPHFTSTSVAVYRLFVQYEPIWNALLVAFSSSHDVQAYRVLLPLQMHLLMLLKCLQVIFVFWAWASCFKRQLVGAAYAMPCCFPWMSFLHSLTHDPAPRVPAPEQVTSQLILVWLSSIITSSVQDLWTNSKGLNHPASTMLWVLFGDLSDCFYRFAQAEILWI